MNKALIIGNITADPQLRTTQAGDAVCTFTVAVNRKRANNAQAGQPEADFFRVSVWRQQGENCAKYLKKGSKVYVSGPVSVTTYTGNDGQTRAQLNVTANEVEFLSSPTTAAQTAPQPAQRPAQQPDNGGFVQVEEEQLPF